MPQNHSVYIVVVVVGEAPRDEQALRLNFSLNFECIEKVHYRAPTGPWSAGLFIDIQIRYFTAEMFTPRSCTNVACNANCHLV